MRIRAYHLYLGLLLLISPQVFSDQEKTSLTVKVSGGIPEKGQAILSIFSSPDTYLKIPNISLTKSIDENGQVTFFVDELVPGMYSVSVIYDEDNNGKLNTGFLGIPSELVGFSNNAKSMFGPPTFNETSFNILEPGVINIELENAKE